MVQSHWNEKWVKLKFDIENETKRKQYAISNYGRIVSFSEKFEDGKLIKGGTLKGYKTLSIKRANLNKTFFVHKLVAQFFCEKKSENQTYVIHSDYVKDNNWFENLQWASFDEMIKHNHTNPSLVEGRAKNHAVNTQKGLKLTATQVMLLKKKLLDPNRKTRIKQLAKQFKVSEMQLYRIKRGELWAHIHVEIPTPEESIELHKMDEETK